MKRQDGFRQISNWILFGLMLIMANQPLAAYSFDETPGHVSDAAMQLVQFCMDPKAGLDERAVATLVDYVLSVKQSREYALPKAEKCQGAYYEFDTRITFPRFMEYSYNGLIPATITRASSLRYSVWSSSRRETQKLPVSWKPLPPAASPVIIRGMQHDSDTPDATTGVYHEYDLERTLVLVNYKGRQVLLSLSKQISTSGVGKKGVILGNDTDWTYYYSGDTGTPKTGLGWVKSYIYDYFSVGVYVETGAATTMVRSGLFQWLRAGWSGINFVKTNHILEGMKRFAYSSRAVLESPRLPAPNEMISVYQWLAIMPASDLQEKYAALQHALRSSAIQAGKAGKSGSDGQPSLSGVPREQMVEELMLEYLKLALGKPTLVGHLLRGPTGASLQSSDSPEGSSRRQ
jgi:hypothetical protein